MTAAPPPPPAAHMLPAGTQLRAGLGVSTVLPDLDFETYSEAGYLWDGEAGKWAALPGAPQGKKGLSVVGVAVYATHPTTEVLSLAYDLKDGRGKRRWLPSMPPPQDLFDHIAACGLLEAWNSGFEHWIWAHVCVPKLGWPPLPLDQLRCAMAKSRSHALPGALGEAGRVLNLVTQKDADGKRLLDKFSMPRNPTKSDPRRRIRPEEDPQDAQRLYGYNATDIETEAEASSRTPDLSPTELAYWLSDQRINYRGVRIDLDAVRASISIIEQAQARYNGEFQRLTGIDSASKLQQLKGWLAGHSVYCDSLDEDGIDALLKRSDLPPAARRPLELRALVGSSSVKKVYAMSLQASPWGRLHNLYNFHGARTGRPTGQGPQPTNLPKAGPNVHRCGYRNGKPLEGLAGCGHHFGAHRFVCPWCGRPHGPYSGAEWSPEAMEDAIEIVLCGSLDLLELFFGEAMLTIAGCLRGFFISEAGKVLVSSDFTAIEGVVIACLAGEQWRIDAYAEGAPMYLLSAERMFGVSVDEMKAYAKANGQHHPLRQKGKGGELGLGFGGWINAIRNFGVDGSDDELKELILLWRGASPAIVEFWGGQSRRDNRGGRYTSYHGLEGMAILSVQNPGVEYPVMRLNGGHTGITFLTQGDVLYARLPSGRTLDYHSPRLAPHRDAWRGLELTFSGWNSNAMKGPPGWMRMQLYGGLLAENVTQAVARDIQMNAIENCEADGAYPVVMHTYDEIVAETGPEATVEELERRMTDLPSWAAGWPIKAAGGWKAPRYRKG